MRINAQRIKKHVIKIQIQRNIHHKLQTFGVPIVGAVYNLIVKTNVMYVSLDLEFNDIYVLNDCSATCSKLCAFDLISFSVAKLRRRKSYICLPSWRIVSLHFIQI